MEYTDITPTEPGYYWMTHRSFGIWQMVEIILNQVGFGDKDMLVIVSSNNAVRPLDDFCNSADNTFLWIGPIEKPEDL